MTDCFLVYVTAPSAAVAATIGRQLVTERLAACANILPEARSFYWWDGQVQEDQEAVLILKTSAASLAALVQRARELHPYSVPAVNAFRIEQGNPQYLDWVRAETRTPG